MSEPMQEFCAAYGCPLLGVYGNGGKWFCCCHRNTDASRNDAITLSLNTHRELVDKALMLRRTRGNFADTENELIELTHQVGSQAPMQMGGVIGPESAGASYTEVDD